MDKLEKIVKKLSEPEYQHLLENVAGRKKNNPYHVLEFIRKEPWDEEALMKKLDVNLNAYYTLKSRLMDRVAVVLSQRPVNAIKEKVANVSASIFEEDKFISVKYLKELEKELLEYDLSNELIVVYKALARHHIYEPEEYEKYDMLYNKHVAYSLAMEKAEDLLLMFIRNIGIYRLTRNPEDFEKILRIRREIYNISELFKSHRLFVLNNIISIYFNCIFITDLAELKQMEMQVDGVLKKFESIFKKYDLDVFYHNLKPLINFMYVQYYYTIGSIPRGNAYYKLLKVSLPDIVGKHSYNFYVIMLLRAKVEKYIVDGNLDELTDLNKLLESKFVIDEVEAYHCFTYGLFRTYIKFFEGDYEGVEKIYKDMKGSLYLREYINGDIQLKLILALCFSLLGEEEKCKKVFASIDRQIDLDNPENNNINLFIKFLKNVTKHAEYNRKLKKSRELFDEFNKANAGTNRILRFINFDEDMIIKLASYNRKNITNKGKDKL
jgi:hypothetical protein